MMEMVIQGVIAPGKAGVVHTDLSPYNILVKDGRPWFISLSEATRVDRSGDSPWVIPRCRERCAAVFAR